MVSGRATKAVALFCFAVSFSYFNALRADDSEALCAVARFDETAQVSFVFDGDTIELSDKRRVRFLGINAPEVAHKGEPGQAFGKESAAQLGRWLPKNTEIGLIFDKEKHDKYGRVLAHVFVDPSQSINARLLASGYAMTLVVPPNEKFLACYDAAEQRAQDADAGLWALDPYRPRSVGSLSADYDGFAIVRGVVRAVGNSRDSVWINFDGDLALRIAKTDLRNFAAFSFDRLQGTLLTARGWIHSSKRGLRMQIRHPSALEIEGRS